QLLADDALELGGQAVPLLLVEGTRPRLEDAIVLPVAPPVAVVSGPAVLWARDGRRGEAVQTRPTAPQHESGEEGAKAAVAELGSRDDVGTGVHAGAPQAVHVGSGFLLVLRPCRRPDAELDRLAIAAREEPVAAPHEPDLFQKLRDATLVVRVSLNHAVDLRIEVDLGRRNRRCLEAAAGCEHLDRGGRVDPVRKGTPNADVRQLGWVGNLRTNLNVRAPELRGRVQDRAAVILGPSLLQRLPFRLREDEV